MKAAFIERHGGPEVLKFGEMPDPVVASGEVMVEIVAASVNGADWKVREGKSNQVARFPYILGRDFSGVVSAIGNGVRDLRVGDEIFGVCDEGKIQTHLHLYVTHWGLPIRLRTASAAWFEASRRKVR